MSLRTSKYTVVLRRRSPATSKWTSFLCYYQPPSISSPLSQTLKPHPPRASLLTCAYQTAPMPLLPHPLVSSPGTPAHPHLPGAPSAYLLAFPAHLIHSAPSTHRRAAVSASRPVYSVLSHRESTLSPSPQQSPAAPSATAQATRAGSRQARRRRSRRA